MVKIFATSKLAKRASRGGDKFKNLGVIKCSISQNRSLSATCIFQKYLAMLSSAFHCKMHDKLAMYNNTLTLDGVHLYDITQVSSFLTCDWFIQKDSKGPGDELHC